MQRELERATSPRSSCIEPGIPGVTDGNKYARIPELGAGLFGAPRMNDTTPTATRTPPAIRLMLAPVTQLCAPLCRLWALGFPYQRPVRQD